jgi:large conductance mechanosensitive channel
LTRPTHSCKVPLSALESPYAALPNLTFQERLVMFKEFKDFAMRGNVVDMAVGIVIGGAFGTIVKSLVDDLLMPPIGLMLGGVDFSNFFLALRDGIPAGPYATLAAAQAAGAVTFRYGLFVNALISFLIVAFALFILIRAMNNLRKADAPAAPATKTCKFCCSAIALDATRCSQCTSQLA